MEAAITTQAAPVAIIDDKGLRFDIVSEWPEGYQVWPIGRRNFLHYGYVPLCQGNNPGDPEDYSVNLDTLKAIAIEEPYATRILTIVHGFRALYGKKCLELVERWKAEDNNNH